MLDTDDNDQTSDEGKDGEQQLIEIEVTDPEERARLIYGEDPSDVEDYYK